MLHKNESTKRKKHVPGKKKFQGEVWIFFKFQGGIDQEVSGGRWSAFILNTFSEFISNKTHIVRELLPNKSKHIFRVHIKHYWHFEGVTPKQYYTLFQTSGNTDIFRELLTNDTTHFSRVYTSNTDIFRESLLN